MRNNDQENVMEHSWMVAVIAHGLAVIHNREALENSQSVAPPTGLETTKSPANLAKVDVSAVVIKALYHDVTEVMTGDLPTPVKYHSPKMKDAYGELEDLAAEQLLHQIPASYRSAYTSVIQPHDPSVEGLLVKAADKISAWLKCVEERRTGNQEFQEAEHVIFGELGKIKLPCVDIWMKLYGPAFEMSLDKLGSLGDSQ